MILEASIATLTDLIYGALYGQHSWELFLDTVRLLVPNGQALLFHHDAAAGSGAFSLNAGADPAMIARYDAYYSTINPWMPHATVRPLGTVVQADAMLSRADLVKTELYNDYLRPQEVETGFGVTIEREGGVNFLFSILCADLDARRAATVREQLQALVPHLRRAFDHYRRRPAVDTPWTGETRPGGGAIVRIGPDSRVLFADAAAVRLAEGCDCLTIQRFGRFATRSRALAEHVAATLASWDGRVRPRQARVFHLRRADGELPLRVAAFRPGGDAGEAFFRGPECVLVIEDPADGLASAVEEFGDLYGLTAAERRLVAGLGAGLGADEYALQGRVSRNTVKTQLRSVFTKTGLNRQADIVRHVCIMAAAGGRPLP